MPNCLLKVNNTYSTMYSVMYYWLYDIYIDYEFVKKHMSYNCEMCGHDNCTQIKYKEGCKVCTKSEVHPHYLCYKCRQKIRRESERKRENSNNTVKKSKKIIKSSNKKRN